VMLKVERPNPNLPLRFHKLYLSLAAMKKGFLEGCRPIVGLDGCFLKGPYKGTLLAARGGGRGGREGSNAPPHLLKKKFYTW
jgi:hypothetical protein